MTRRRWAQPDIVSGPLFKGIFLFSIPIMLTGVLQLLYNAADLIVVGRFAENGELAVAAVGSTGSLVSLIVNLFMGLSVGASVTLAIALGARMDASASRIVHTAITLAAGSGLVIGVVGFFGAETFLSWMGSPENVIGPATLYLKIYFCGAPAMMIYNFGAAILRTSGDTKRPLIILAIAGMINVILNLICVIGLDLSVAGVAIGTIASQYFSAVIVVICLMRKAGPCRLELKKLRIHKSELSRILLRGIPAGIQSSVFAISNVIVQSGVNSFGEVTVAGAAASGNIDGFVYIVLNAFYHACITYAGQNLGAGNAKRVNQTYLYSAIQVMMTWAVVGTFVCIFAEPLLNFYLPDNPEAIPDGVLRLRLLASTYFLCGLMEIGTGHSRGLGASLMPMIMSIIGVCGMRIGWLLFVFPQNRSVFMLFLSFPLSWGVTAAAQLVGNRIVWRKLKTRIFLDKEVQSPQ